MLVHFKLFRCRLQNSPIFLKRRRFAVRVIAVERVDCCHWVVFVGISFNSDLLFVRSSTWHLPFTNSVFQKFRFFKTSIWLRLLFSYCLAFFFFFRYRAFHLLLRSGKHWVFENIVPHRFRSLESTYFLRYLSFYLWFIFLWCGVLALGTYRLVLTKLVFCSRRGRL